MKICTKATRDGYKKAQVILIMVNVQWIDTKSNVYEYFGIVFDRQLIRYNDKQP